MGADTDSDRADTSPDFLHRNALSADTLLKDSLSPLNCQENSFNKDQSDFTLTPSSLGYCKFTEVAGVNPPSPTPNDVGVINSNGYINTAAHASPSKPSTGYIQLPAK